MFGHGPGPATDPKTPFHDTHRTISIINYRCCMGLVGGSARVSVERRDNCGQFVFPQGAETMSGYSSILMCV